MKSTTSSSCWLAVLSLALVAIVDGKSLRAGQCGATLQACYLRNLDTQEEHALANGESDMTTYAIGNKEARFSIRCDTEGVEKVVYTFPIATDQQQHVANTSPWWTNAGEGEWVNPVKHLSNCGPKTVQVVGYKGEDECFAEEFTIQGECAQDLCSFQCPSYSQPREGHTCLASFDNCECWYSYKFVSDYCVKDWCYHDFQCPENKERIPARDCYVGPPDCKFTPRTANE